MDEIFYIWGAMGLTKVGSFHHIDEMKVKMPCVEPCKKMHQLCFSFSIYGDDKKTAHLSIYHPDLGWGYGFDLGNAEDW